MKQFRNALNITIENYQIVKGGYIQLPEVITITDEWLGTPSLLYKEESNRDHVLSELHDLKIIGKDLETFIGKTVCAVPDETVYSVYLEIVRGDKVMDQDMAYEDMQKFLIESDAYIENLTNRYSEIVELLISRVWNYHMFKEQVKLDRLINVYKEMIIECTVQTLVFIAVNTPHFGLEMCFKA